MRLMFVAVGLTALNCSPALAAPPKELVGKSIVINWTEVRDQKEPTDTAVRSVTRNGELILYVSGAGRVFNRMSYIGGRGGGGGKKARYANQSDQVGGGADKVENRSVNFKGQSATVHTSMSGGARAVIINFAPGFSGCTAQAMTGKESSSGKIVARSLSDGHQFEIHKIQTSAASCSIYDSNRLGGG